MIVTRLSFGYDTDSFPFRIIYGYFEMAAREGDIGSGLKGLVPGN